MAGSVRSAPHAAAGVFPPSQDNLTRSVQPIQTTHLTGFSTPGGNTTNKGAGGRIGDFPTPVGHLRFSGADSVGGAEGGVDDVRTHLTAPSAAPSAPSDEYLSSRGNIEREVPAPGSSATLPFSRLIQERLVSYLAPYQPQYQPQFFPNHLMDLHATWREAHAFATRMLHLGLPLFTLMSLASLLSLYDVSSNAIYQGLYVTITVGTTNLGLLLFALFNTGIWPDIANARAGRVNDALQNYKMELNTLAKSLLEAAYVEICFHKPLSIILTLLNTKRVCPYSLNNAMKVALEKLQAYLLTFSDGNLLGLGGYDRGIFDTLIAAVNEAISLLDSQRSNPLATSPSEDETGIPNIVESLPEGTDPSTACYRIAQLRAFFLRMANRPQVISVTRAVNPPPQQRHSPFSTGISGDVPPLPSPSPSCMSRLGVGCMNTARKVWEYAARFTWERLGWLFPGEPLSLLGLLPNPTSWRQLNNVIDATSFLPPLALSPDQVLRHLSDNRKVPITVLDAKTLEQGRFSYHETDFSLTRWGYPSMILTSLLGLIPLWTDLSSNLTNLLVVLSNLLPSCIGLWITGYLPMYKAYLDIKSLGIVAHYKQVMEQVAKRILDLYYLGKIQGVSTTPLPLEQIQTNLVTLVENFDYLIPNQPGVGYEIFGLLIDTIQYVQSKGMKAPTYAILAKWVAAAAAQEQITTFLQRSAGASEGSSEAKPPAPPLGVNSDTTTGQVVVEVSPVIDDYPQYNLRQISSQDHLSLLTPYRFLLPENSTVYLLPDELCKWDPDPHTYRNFLRQITKQVNNFPPEHNFVILPFSLRQLLIFTRTRKAQETMEKYFNFVGRRNAVLASFAGGIIAAINPQTTLTKWVTTLLTFLWSTVYSHMNNDYTGRYPYLSANAIFDAKREYKLLEQVFDNLAVFIMQEYCNGNTAVVEIFKKWNVKGDDSQNVDRLTLMSEILKSIAGDPQQVPPYNPLHLFGIVINYVALSELKGEKREPPVVISDTPLLELLRLFSSKPPISSDPESTFGVEAFYLRAGAGNPYFTSPLCRGYRLAVSISPPPSGRLRRAPTITQTPNRVPNSSVDNPFGGTGVRDPHLSDVYGETQEMRPVNQLLGS